MNQINFKKIRTILSKKSSSNEIKEGYYDLKKIKFDESFDLIDEITEFLEKAYIHERAEEANRNNPHISISDGINKSSYFIDLDTVFRLLREVRNSLIASTPSDTENVFEENLNEGTTKLYKKGDVKLDDGNVGTLSSVDADYLNAFAGTSLKWYRTLTKSLKDFKEVIQLSKT